MNFVCEDLPSSSLSAPIKEEEDLLMTEDADCDSSASESMTEVQGQFSSSSIDDISRRVQEMIENINHSRTSNQNVMDSFQKKLTEKVTEMCQQMKEHMHTVYVENGAEMEVKLQELSEVLESCTQLNRELLEATQALACLREGLAFSQTEP